MEYLYRYGDIIDCSGGSDVKGVMARTKIKMV